jgi:predicted transcriptional regulator
MMSDMVRLDTGEGQDMAMDTWAEYQYLKGLMANGTPVIYQEGHSEYLVIVRGLQWVDQQVRGMNSRRTGLQGILGVTLLTSGW